MKITIIERVDQNSVVFNSEFGVGKGIWQNEMPSVGKDYYIEIDIKDILIWGQDILFCDTSAPEIGMENEGHYFIGLLESVDDDGYAVLRLNGNIISIMTRGTPFRINQYVKVLAREMGLYPYDI